MEHEVSLQPGGEHSLQTACWGTMRLEFMLMAPCPSVAHHPDRVTAIEPSTCLRLE